VDSSPTRQAIYLLFQVFKTKFGKAKKYPDFSIAIIRKYAIIPAMSKQTIFVLICIALLVVVAIVAQMPFAYATGTAKFVTLGLAAIPTIGIIAFFMMMGKTIK
jgi:hypothetical protein